jgi:hypothetical protein
MEKLFLVTNISQWLDVYILWIMDLAIESFSKYILQRLPLFSKNMNLGFHFLGILTRVS